MSKICWSVFGWRFSCCKAALLALEFILEKKGISETPTFGQRHLMWAINMTRYVQVLFKKHFQYKGWHTLVLIVNY